ncbi:hypothetical protein F4810DRAFT_704990 [Camillea tinctor]|nr:hypothetical protein F4810DRAFT_704990 [Camillea tinctor]
MAYHPQQGGGSSFPMFFPQRTRGFAPEAASSSSFSPFRENQFDILEWYPQFQSCVRYFLDHAQYDGPIQAMAAFINIQLPFQKSPNPIASSRLAGSSPGVPSPSSPAAGKLPMPNQLPACVSLNPYIRRLVATGFDFPGVLHGFFGDNWALGIGHIHEVERRNYLFAAKSSSWLDVKSQYDMPDGQSVPFLRPLQNVTEKEIVSAEANWSQWLAMQDWMIGPRNPEVDRDTQIVVKDEDD